MDISDLYKFCPVCGKEALKTVAKNKISCTNCGHEIYINPSIGGAALIFDDKGRLLVVKRSKEPAKGAWDLPGGFVEVRETVEEGIIREVREELNIEVEPKEYLFSIPNQYVYKNLERYPLDFFFKCSIKDMSQLKVDESENSAYTFLAPSEIRYQDFGLSSIQQAIKRYFKQ